MAIKGYEANIKTDKAQGEYKILLQLISLSHLTTLFTQQESRRFFPLPDFIENLSLSNLLRCIFLPLIIFMSFIRQEKKINKQNYL